MKTTHSVDTVQKLIDLNGDLVNFDIEFKVSSKGGAPFDLAVVDQTTLDNKANLEFRRVNGEISGNVKNDKGVPQNFFLVLKANEPCECEVELSRRQLPVKQQHHHLPIKQEYDWSKIAVYVIGIAAAAIGIYFWWKSKDKEGQENNPRDNAPENNNRDSDPRNPDSKVADTLKTNSYRNRYVRNDNEGGSDLLSRYDRPSYPNRSSYNYPSNTFGDRAKTSYSSPYSRSNDYNTSRYTPSKYSSGYPNYSTYRKPESAYRKPESAYRKPESAYRNPESAYTKYEPPYRSKAPYSATTGLTSSGNDTFLERLKEMKI
jgi:hypothetical protein